MNNQKDKILDKLKYYACSFRERLLLYHYFLSHPEVNISEYTSWSSFTHYDCILSSGNSISKLVEVKFREFRSKQFETTFIEPSKFAWLREIAYERNLPVEYWNFYSRDGVLEVFDLNNVEYYETEQKRTGKDCFDSLIDDESTVYELDKQFASYYTFDKSISYENKSKLILSERMPEYAEQIKALDLSKYFSYLSRKENKK